MCKKALCLIVLLFSGVCAYAQQSQPGYAVLTPDQGSARSGSSILGAGPPEPAAVGGLGGGPIGSPQAPGGYLPVMPGPGMNYPPAPGGPGMNPYPLTVGPALGDGSVPMYGAPSYSGDPTLPIVGPTATFGSEAVWFSLDYVAGWLQKPRLNAPLLTEGSASDAHPGALGQPGTVVAFGDDNYKFGTYHGFQTQLGVNLNDQISLEVSALLFPSQHVVWTTGSDINGSPLLSRPVFNTVDGQERSYLTSYPGTLVGTTTIEAHSELWGIEAAARYKFAITPYLTGDFLLGYRQMELVENLTISDNLTPLQPSITFLGSQVNPSPGTYLADYDRFATNNTFNGVDFGGRLRWQSGFDWFSMMTYWKEAIGATTQTANLSGATSLVTPGGTVTAPGGILVQPSNGGNYTRSVFGSITEGGVGFAIVPYKYMRFEIGYSATYWNSVIRPGNQINHAVTPSQVPTDISYSGTAAGNQPTYGFRSQGLTIQTLNFGMTFYY